VDALETLSPTLADDFKLTNEMWKRRIAIGKTLRPNISSELMDLGELGKLAQSIITFSFKPLSTVLGISSARKLAREMLINPKLQNLQNQMLKAANERKFSLVERMADYLFRNYRDESLPNQSDNTR